MSLAVFVLTKGESSVSLASLGYSGLLHLLFKDFKTRRHVWNVEFKHFLDNMIVPWIYNTTSTT